jgi:membrane protease YdiL (CAAX protease family)
MTPTSPKSAPFPSAPQAAGLLLAGFMLQYVVGAALYDLRQFLGLTYEQVETMGMLLSNGILISVVMHILRIGYPELLHPSKTSPVTTFFFLAPPILLLLPLIVLLDMALIWALEAIFPLSSWEQAAFARMGSPTLPAFIATCLIAPFVEEMLFRGVLLRAFLERYPRGLAISYSALYFGAAHLNIYQFFLAFLLGLFLGWLYERSRSLVPCIVLHGALNTTVSALSAIEGSTETQDPFIVPALAWLAAAIAAAVGAIALHRLLSRLGKSETAPQKRSS